MYLRTGLGSLRAIRERFSRHEFDLANAVPLLEGLPTNVSDVVAAAIQDLGRCEDLSFSPGGGRLVIAGFNTRRCLILRVVLDQDGGIASLGEFLEVESPAITQPHGIDWIDDSTLAIGNRNGDIAVVPVPPESGNRRVSVQPLAILTGKRFTRVAWPGSVAVARPAPGKVSILAVNNYIDRVSEHFVDQEASFNETGSRIVLARGLHIPDGLAIDGLGGWIAISCNGSRDVKLFPPGRRGRLTPPAGVCNGANYPHGICFTADGSALLVADAGSPYVHVYRREEGWKGARQPERSVQVLTNETYERGCSQANEGGPKGIDIDPSGRVVAICCENQGLKLLSLAALCGDSGVATGAAEDSLAQSNV